MPELRQDKITGEWVILAPERANRPTEFAAQRPPSLPLECPFCAGHEYLMPDCVAEFPAEPSAPAQSQANANGAWSVRVISNKYPALISNELAPSSSLPPPGNWFHGANGAGLHEVVVESPRHVASFSELTPHEAKFSLRAYRDRLLHMREHQLLASGIAFKNCGPAGGASLVHVHSQVVGMPFVPPVLAAEVAGVRSHFLQTGGCLFCELLQQETQLGQRILVATPEFVVHCPFASRMAFEVWIVPRRHLSAFEFEDNDVLDKLAPLMQHVIRQFERLLGPCPYNFIVHSAPFQTEAAHFHWHVELFPRLTPLAGFEWGTGCYINSILPEDAAARLRIA